LAVLFTGIDKKELIMEFKSGDSVIHWAYGLGAVVGVQERALSGEKLLYYVVQVRDLTVWVPVDDKAGSRLRPPTSQQGFKKLFKILSEPGKALSEDRHERKSDLHRRLQDGNAESICAVIRDLTSYQQIKALNDDEKQILKRACTSLLGEWGYSFSLSAAEAEAALHHLLREPALSIASL
jgi:RNA polymerase-interacting CarD/CdnL/TRCF family regulator